MKRLLRSSLAVAGLAAIGIVPMLVVVAGLKAIAADGTVLWEFPKLPSVTVTVVHGPQKGTGGMTVAIPLRPAKPVPARSGGRRPARVDI
jgi:hypothetical protein